MSPAFPLVAVTQRVDVISDRDERRDALDQRWAPFIAACGFTVLPLPNIGAEVKCLLDQIRVQGVVLSGGNDLSALGGNAPERDQTENAIIEWASSHQRPLIGVCRGMQLLAYRDGVKIEPITGHVAVRHELKSAQEALQSRTVNSYHNWSVRKLTPDWIATLSCDDGSIEGMRHRSLPQCGIMWHPERETPFAEADIKLFQDFFRDLS